MKSQILVKRYTQGLVNALKDEEEFEICERELSEFSKLLSGRKELKDILSSPFLGKNKKDEIIKEILARMSFHKITSRFILVLLEHNRLELLANILGFLPLLWNERKGIATFEVTSVIPLKEVQRERLKEKLEFMEKKPVALNFKIDPGLIGGLCLRRGNIVYDVSLKGNLSKLKEKICER